MNSKPIIPKDLSLEIPPYLVRLGNDSIGQEIKSNFSIDPRLGKLQYSRVETYVKRRRGFSTAYANLKTSLKDLDEKTTTTDTKVTKTLVFKKFSAENQGLYYRSGWVSQLPASIFPHLFYPYTAILLKEKTGFFGADVNGCSYGESFIDKDGITIPVSNKKLDCILCTSYGYPAPKVVLVSDSGEDSGDVQTAPQYVISGIRTQVSNLRHNTLVSTGQ